MTTDNKLIAFWNDQKANEENINLSEAALAIQRQAEIDVATARNESAEAEDKLRKVKVAAQKDKNFKAIAEASLAVKIARKRYDEYLETYKELFGEEPKLLS